MVERLRTPCGRTAEEVDFGDGPDSVRVRRYVMVCSTCGLEAWQHKHAVSSAVVVGQFVSAETFDRESEAA